MRASTNHVSDSVQGCVDSAEAGCVRGWAFHPRHADKRIEIGIYLGEVCLLSVKADRFRQDLLDIGYGDGCHGFEANIRIELFTTPQLRLSVRFMDGGRELTGSPVEMKASFIVLDPPIFTALDESINAVSQAAETAGSLDALHAWLSHNHDLVYKRQTTLNRLGRHHDIWFNEFLTQTVNLTEVLGETANAIVAQYQALHLEMVDDPEVTVIIPAYNQFAYTHRCLQSILTHKPAIRFDVVLVDDGSTDETLYASLVVSGGIQVMRNPRNGGFVGAVNASLPLARGKYLFLLNNDTEVQDGWLDHLFQTFMGDPSVGVAGSKLIYPSGLLQEAGGVISRQGTVTGWGKDQDPNDPRYCFMRETDFVSGSALMVERALFDHVGGLSEAFSPGYYEDADLCFKVRAAGRRVVVQPRSRVTHHEGVSSGGPANAQHVKRFQRLNHRTFLLKWLETLQHHGVGDADLQREVDRFVTRRALFVDDAVPMPDQDTASKIAIDHMASLQRLGFKVSFAGSDHAAKQSPYTDTLEGLGIQCHYRPYSHSVEDIINDSQSTYDVFFIHHVANMERYAALIRRRFPEASIVYGMAGLQHLGLEREAAFKQDKALQLRAGTTKRIELAMLAAADAVVVHSDFERQYVEDLVPSANVYVIAWTPTGAPSNLAFGERRGIAFIGEFDKTAHVDAAIWLVSEILPLVWLQDPTIECSLMGSQMPGSIQGLSQEGVHVIGHLPNMQPVLDRVRLTVAPPRYGAGLQGQVLTSLAAGLPCVATPYAVEGVDAPSALDRLVASTPEDLAAKILLAYHDEALNTASSKAGLDMVARHCSQGPIDQSMRDTTSRSSHARMVAEHPAKAPSASTKRQKPKRPSAKGSGLPTQDR